jgi:hypothetical protein
MRFVLCKGPRIVVVSLPSPEEGNRSGFRNDVFLSYLEFRMMTKVHNLGDPECYTP